MRIDIAALHRIGSGLRRPESVLCARNGDIFVAHAGVGVLHVAPDGTQRPIGRYAEVDGTAFVPNGLARLADGSFLIANMGEAGGVWRLSLDGALSPYLREADGERLQATNFVLRDRQDRVWITVTTRRWPISDAFSPEVADGYVVLIDGGTARIVADGLVFANELRVDPTGRFLYVVETMARRISRFAIRSDNRLGQREVFTTFGHGTFPDGIAFDADGHLWVASIVSNRVIRVGPAGEQDIVLEDSSADYLAQVEEKMAAGSLSREDMQSAPSKVLKHISSIAFGGPDLRTAYLGSLGGDTIPLFRAPVAGDPPAHWHDVDR
jgi:sugar lactone lactonase YvrE